MLTLHASPGLTSRLRMYTWTYMETMQSKSNPKWQRIWLSRVYFKEPIIERLLSIFNFKFLVNLQHCIANQREGTVVDPLQPNFPPGCPLRIKIQKVPDTLHCTHHHRAGQKMSEIFSRNVLNISSHFAFCEDSTK